MRSFVKYSGPGIASQWSDQATDWTIRLSNPIRGRRCLCLPQISRWVLGSTQPPIQWVRRVCYFGAYCGRVLRLTTNPHLVPGLYMSSRREQGQPYLWVTVVVPDDCVFLATCSSMVPSSNPVREALRPSWGNGGSWQSSKATARQNVAKIDS